MIQLTGIPSAYIDEDSSPPVESYLLATDAPIIFAFQRNDGEIDSFDESTSPAGFVVLTMTGTYELNENDEISIYDAASDSMLSATVVDDLGSDQFLLDLEYDASYSLEYIINSTQLQYYYLEIRLKINGVYESSTIRFSPNSKGVILADVSAYIASKVSGTKVGAYLNDSDAETYQSGNFTLEYRERYAGDSSTYTEEGNTWYYVFCTRTKEQGANLYDYDYTEDMEGKYFNEFEELYWSVGLPLDIQFWWNPTFDSLDAIIRVYDAGNTLIETLEIPLDDSAKGYLTSVRLDLDSIDSDAAYMTVEIVDHVGSP